MCINEFLDLALIRLSKSQWVDDTLARLAISTAIQAQGLTNMDTLVKDILIKVIEIWSDKMFIKQSSSRERICKEVISFH